MKSIKQLSDEEQREARIMALGEQFAKEMQQIEADYRQRMERWRRFHRNCLLAFTIAASLALLLPALAILWRLTR